MANTYYTLLTQAGQASIANAIALGQQVTLTHMAVGDGNGSPTVPKETQTELVHEVYRAAINQLLTDPDNPNYLIAEMIVPTNVGGWFVREVGLFDEDDNLLAIANFPETYKPKLEEGSGRDLIIRIILQVQSTDAITLKIDPTIVLASQAWVKENFTRAILLPGGTTGQFLAKKSNADGDTEWKDLEIPEQVNADWNATEGATAILNKPKLSAVATSGDYNDLVGTPLLSAIATSGNYNDLTGKPARGFCVYEAGNYTFTVPTGVTSLKVCCIGGGGGGNFNHGTPGNGGNTTFGEYITAYGGIGGPWGADGPGGAAGYCSQQMYVTKAGESGATRQAYTWSNGWIPTSYGCGQAGTYSGGSGSTVYAALNVTPGENIPVNVGTGGWASSGSGVSGICIVEW